MARKRLTRIWRRRPSPTFPSCPPIQRLPNGADAPVHHVRWRDHVAARLGLDDGLLREDLDGFVVQDLSVDDEAVLAMGRVGIQGDVANDAQFAAGFTARTVRQARLSGFRASCPFSVFKLDGVTEKWPGR